MPINGRAASAAKMNDTIDLVECDVGVSRVSGPFKVTRVSSG